MKTWVKIGGAAAALGLAVWALRSSMSSREGTTHADTPLEPPHMPVENPVLDAQQEVGYTPEPSSSPPPPPPSPPTGSKPTAARLQRAERKRVQKQTKPQRKPSAVSDVVRSQITITNNGSSKRAIRLWGSGDHPIVDTDPTVIDDHAIVQTIGETGPVFNHPQGAVCHTDGLLYVVNQLGDSITRLNEAGQVQGTIDLGAIAPSTISPVAIASHTGTDELYVVGSLTNALYVLDDTQQVAAIIGVGSRPVAVAVHPTTGKVYTVNHMDDTVSVVDPATHTIETTLSAGSGPIGIAFDPLIGDVYVCNKHDDSVSVFSATHQAQGTIASIGTAPVSLVHCPDNDRLYITASGDNALVELDPTTRTITQTYIVGSGPYRVDYHPVNGMIYVANRGDQTFSIVDPADQLVATIPAPGLNIGWAIHPSSGKVFLSGTTNNTVAVLGFDPLQSSISLSPGYFNLNEEFKYNPVSLTHTKWVQSNADPVRTLKLIDRSPTGQARNEVVSLTNYQSPQHALGITEITESNGWIIDGRNTWEFNLAAGQTATILIAYRQWVRSSLVKPTTPTKTPTHV